MTEKAFVSKKTTLMVTIGEQGGKRCRKGKKRFRQESARRKEWDWEKKKSKTGQRKDFARKEYRRNAELEVFDKHDENQRKIKRKGELTQV